MDKKIKQHEAIILDALKFVESFEQVERIYKYHTNMLSNFQSERLIHLIVTLFIGLFSLITCVALIISNNIIFMWLSGLLTTLLVPYILHYYYLENGVQSLYKLDLLIVEKLEELS